MHKYLIAETQEMDGHAFGAAHYVQTDEPIDTREKRLAIIQEIVSGIDGKFVEPEREVRDPEDIIFYGEIVFDGYSWGSNASYHFKQLPSRISKSKIYTAEITTG